MRDSHLRQAAALIAAFAALALAAPAGATTLDQTFGTGGIVVVPNDVGGVARAESIAALPNGKVLVVARAVGTAGEDFGLLRFNTDGSLDTTFGPAHTGIVTTSFGSGNDVPLAVRVQADGKIVVSGQSQQGATGIDFAVARYDSGGNPDPTFNGGKRTVPVSAGNDIAWGLGLEPGGAVVLAGAANGNEFGLVGLDNTGQLDNQFGTNGITTLKPSSGDVFVEAAAEQPDGKMLLTGEIDVDSDVAKENFDIGVARFNADGSLDGGPSTDDSNTGDTPFGTAGVTTIGFDLKAAGYDFPDDIAVQGDGKVMVVGAAQTASGQDWALARLTAAGGLDNSGAGAFNTDGKLNMQLGPSNATTEARAVGIQPDGKIVAAGESEGATTGTDWTAARFTTTGNLDGTFDFDGLATTPIASGNALEEPLTLAVTQGRIVTAGIANVSGNKLTLVSYNQYDADDDGVADARDNCPAVENLDQANLDRDAKGDVCDPDDDNDGHADGADNCPRKANPTQADLDRDGLGDACDPTPRGKPSPGNDTLVGTAGANTIHGLAGNDRIFGLGGGDRLFGDAGADLLDGGPGPDTLVGGKGKDTHKGGGGNDTIRAADGVAENVNCGKGKNDKATVDKKDVVSGCEHVTRK